MYKIESLRFILLRFIYVTRQSMFFTTIANKLTPGKIIVEKIDVF